jgi:hypothetical protein
MKRKVYRGTMKQVWEETPKYKKEKLLKAMGLHPSFAQVKKYEDLPKRSGGHVKHDIDKLFKEAKRRKIF